VEIVITDQGVIFDMTDGQSAINKAVQHTFAAADLFDWKARGLHEIADNRYKVIFDRKHSHHDREAFASRLVFELRQRGVAAEVVA
jgi:hypothetical protein